MSHNNGNLWFTLFDRLFYVSSTLNGSCAVLLWLSHISLSLYFTALYGLSHLTAPLGHIKHPLQVTPARETHQETRGAHSIPQIYPSNTVRALYENTRLRRTMFHVVATFAIDQMLEGGKERVLRCRLKMWKCHTYMQNGGAVELVS